MSHGNQIDNFMKKLIILFYVLLSSIFATAQVKLDVKEGVFLNSIDWFIKSTVDYWINLPTPKKITSFNQLGVVRVDFYGMSDSLEVKKNLKEDSSGNFIDVIAHARCKYFLTARTRFVAAKIPPSFYFIRNGVPIVIYTGFERFVRFDEKNVKELQKSLGSEKVEIQLDAIKEYWIKMDSKYPGGYVTTELKKKPDD